MQKITEHHYDSINRYNRKTTVLSIWNSADPDKKWHFLLTPDEIEQNEERGFHIKDFYSQPTDFPDEYLTFNLQSQALYMGYENAWASTVEDYINTWGVETTSEYPCWEFNDNVEIFFKNNG